MWSGLAKIIDALFPPGPSLLRQLHNLIECRQRLTVVEMSEEDYGELLGELGQNESPPSIRVAGVLVRPNSRLGEGQFRCA